MQGLRSLNVAQPALKRSPIKVQRHRKRGRGVSKQIKIYFSLSSVYRAIAAITASFLPSRKASANFCLVILTTASFLTFGLTTHATTSGFCAPPPTAAPRGTSTGFPLPSAGIPHFVLHHCSATTPSFASFRRCHLSWNHYCTILLRPRPAKATKRRPQSTSTHPGSRFSLLRPAPLSNVLFLPPTQPERLAGSRSPLSTV